MTYVSASEKTMIGLEHTDKNKKAKHDGFAALGASQAPPSSGGADTAPSYSSHRLAL